MTRAPNESFPNWDRPSLEKSACRGTGNTSGWRRGPPRDKAGCALEYELPFCVVGSSVMEVRMIVVRNTFVCRPGSASKLAAQLKEAVASQPDMKARVLTDLTGDFNRVVLEFEGNNFGDFEARMAEYEKEGAFREKMKGYTDHYLTGTREIFKVN